MAFIGENLFNRIKGKIVSREDLEKSFQLLKENQAQGQHLAKIGSWTYDLKEGKVFFSDEAYHILGIAYQEFNNNLEDYYRHVHPDDLNGVKEAIQGSLKGKEYDMEYRILKTDGVSRIVHEKTKALYGETNHPIKMIGILHDITKEKKDENSLSAMKEPLFTPEKEIIGFTGTVRDLIQNNPLEKEIIYMKKNLDKAQRLAKMGSWEINIGLGINFLSEEALRIIGITVEEYDGTIEKFLSFIHPEDREISEIALRYPSNEKSFSLEYRIIKGDGSVRNIYQLGETTFNTEGVPICIYGTIQDITEKKEMQRIIEKKEKEIEDIKEKFQVMVQESGDVFEIIASDGTIKYISETSEKVVKYKAEKLIGEKIYKFYEGEELEKLTKMVDFVLVDPRNKTRQVLTFKTKSLKNVHLEVNMQNLLDNPVIEGIVLNFRDVTKRVETERKMYHTANYDELTGLPNRSYFKNELAASCRAAKEEGSLLAVMMLDFDGFKYINGALGFQSGNQMIIQMMIRLRALLGDENFISRYSEDQFAVIVKNLMNLEAYEAMARSIVGLFSQAFKVDVYEFDVTMNMGISIFSASDRDFEEQEDEEPEEKEPEEEQDGEQDGELLIKHANIALLWAKKEGKNHCRFYATVISIENYKQFELRNDLRRAIEKKQFEVFYQPVIKLKTNEILSAEALIRWNHPDWGLVSPNEFIYLAKETGVIIEMGKWMLREICKNYKNWMRKGFPQIKMAINFSSIQFYEKDFSKNIKGILDEFGLDPKFLIIELTEDLLIEDGNKAIHDIQKLQSLGIKVALDDFGTGFSSLTYLNTFNIDILKMDGAFLKDVMTDEAIAVIARTIVRLVRELKIELVAEGIENWEQLSFLREINCHAGQGYIYSRPLELEAFEKILENGKCKPALSNNNYLKPQIERRNFFRLDFHQFLKADLTILKIKDKKMNLGNTKILIENIGPGGICFISNIKFPIEREFTLQFSTFLLDKKIKAHGSPVWTEEIADNLYRYGVQFLIDENEREELMKTLYEIQIKIKKNILYEDGNFTPDSPLVHFNEPAAN